jgi:hypothetical protein
LEAWTMERVDDLLNCSCFDFLGFLVCLGF